MNIHQAVTQVTEFLDKSMSTKTVIGEAQTFGNITVIPVMDVTVGFGGGGGEGNTKENQGTGGGSGAAMRMAPKAVIVIKEGEVSVMPLGKGSAIDKIMEKVPGLIEKMSAQKAEKAEAKAEAKTAE
jgi:uncharacterized spore protein YtfJ